MNEECEERIATLIAERDAAEQRTKVYAARNAELVSEVVFLWKTLAAACDWLDDKPEATPDWRDEAFILLLKYGSTMEAGNG